MAEFCDVCKTERLSVLEGEKYICEVCLDVRPAAGEGAKVKV